MDRKAFIEIVLAVVAFIASVINFLIWLFAVLRPASFPEPMAELAQSVLGMAWAVANLSIAVYAALRLKQGVGSTGAQVTGASSTPSRHVGVSDETMKLEVEGAGPVIQSRGPVAIVTIPASTLAVIGLVVVLIFIFWRLMVVTSPMPTIVASSITATSAPDTPAPPTNTPVAPGVTIAAPPTDTPSPVPTASLEPPTPTPTRVLTATPTPSPTPTTAFTATATLIPKPMFTVNQATVNVRAGPGIDYPVIGALRQGETFEITGKNAAGNWWQFAYNNKTGWIHSGLVSAKGTDAVAVVTNVLTPPTATALPETADQAVYSECQIEGTRMVGCTLSIKNLTTRQIKSIYSSAVILWPTWSPDGERIAFVAASSNEGQYSISIVNIDGTNLIQVTSDPPFRWPDNPAWSPDGTLLAFGHHGYSDSHALYVLDLQSREIVYSKGPHRNWPHWTVDGQFVLVGSIYDNGYLLDPKANIELPLDHSVRVFDQRYYPWRVVETTKALQPNSPYAPPP